MSVEMIRLESLDKAYANERVLRGIDLTVEAGEFCVVVGPSGCGKSTLLKCIAGLDRPDDGAVRLRDRPADVVPVEDRDVGFVFQEFEETLFPHRTVRENVAFGLEHADESYDETEIEAEIDAVLELLSIEETKESKPGALSGGQQQRVELARQLVRECDVMLLDDPLADLDYKLQKRMELEIRRLHERLGSTFVYVTHNQEQALTLADRVVVMNRGVVEQVGTPREVYESPENAFVGRFIGDSNPFVATVETVEGESIVVETELGRMAATTDANARIGMESLALVRPTDVTIGPGTATDNAYTGTIAGTTYTGEETEVSVSIDRLDRRIQVIEPGRPAVGEPGEEVVVGWDRTDAHFFEELSAADGTTAADLLEV